MSSFQRPLFCPCGREPAVAGRCLRCYGAEWYSRHRFGGHRTRVLARDRGTCRVCGDASNICVHHRRPGSHDPRLLISVCRACHARLHHRFQVPPGAPELLASLWREQHEGWPLQLSLSWALAPGALKKAA